MFKQCLKIIILLVIMIMWGIIIIIINLEYCDYVIVSILVTFYTWRLISQKYIFLKILT